MKLNSRMLTEGLAIRDETTRGLPIEVFDAIRAGVAGDRSQFYKDLAVQFYGANRPGAKVSQGILDQFWLWSMQAGTVNDYESVKAFSETDFTEDLKKFDFPTLVLHGEDDQIVPVKDLARKSAKLIKGAKEISRRFRGDFRMNGEKGVHMQAKTGFWQMAHQSVKCVRCEKHFEVMIPDAIVAGPFLPLSVSSTK